jgi:hypothetical protein
MGIWDGEEYISSSCSVWVVRVTINFVGILDFRVQIFKIVDFHLEAYQGGTKGRLSSMIARILKIFLLLLAFGNFHYYMDGKEQKLIII